MLLCTLLSPTAIIFLVWLARSQDPRVPPNSLPPRVLRSTRVLSIFLAPTRQTRQKKTKSGSHYILSAPSNWSLDQKKRKPRSHCSPLILHLHRLSTPNPLPLTQSLALLPSSLIHCLAQADGDRSCGYEAVAGSLVKCSTWWHIHYFGIGLPCIV